MNGAFLFNRVQQVQKWIDDLIRNYGAKLKLTTANCLLGYLHNIFVFTARKTDDGDKYAKVVVVVGDLQRDKDQINVTIPQQR